MPTRDKDSLEVSKGEREMRTRLASRLEEFRQKEGLTLKFIADAAQLTDSHLSQLLLGKTNVTLKTLVKLAYALDVDVIDLLKNGPVIRPKPKRGRPKIRRAAK